VAVIEVADGEALVAGEVVLEELKVGRDIPSSITTLGSLEVDATDRVGDKREPLLLRSHKMSS